MKAVPNDQSTELIRQQLLPRVDKYRALVASNRIPQSTQNHVIVHCLSKAIGFKKNEYEENRVILADVMNETVFNDFVQRANQIIENEMILKSKQENEPFFSVISSLLRLSIGIVTVAFSLFAAVIYGNLDPNTGDLLLNITMAMLGVTGGIAGISPIFLQIAKYSPLDYENVIFKKLKDLAIVENQTSKMGKQKITQWRIQPNFFWLELHIQRQLIYKPNCIVLDTE